MTGSKDFDVIVVGDLNADLVLTGDVVPQFGQVEKLVDDATLALGSSAGIFACGAARLGLKTALISKVGDDTFGHFLLAELKSHHVDTRGVVIDPGVKTGLTVILNRGADRAILTHLGSISEIRLTDIGFDLLSRGRHLHLAAYYLLTGLMPEVPALFTRAQQLGLSTSLDTNYDPSETWDGQLREVLKHVSFVLPNETELLSMTGARTLEEGIKATASLAPLVVIKLGAQGALARQGDETTTAPGLKVDVVDTVGAGDTFDSGFLYGYLAHWPLERSLRLACICGSLSTRAAGGIMAQPTLEEALRYLD
ncbi:MAG TPA: carbohydrate kinase family protein [Longilinea sp.]|nr:carbohydrate kinase family protein [Longilinea sp.]